jgi:hypothetical protein
MYSEFPLFVLKKTQIWSLNQPIKAANKKVSRLILFALYDIIAKMT